MIHRSKDVEFLIMIMVNVGSRQLSNFFFKILNHVQRIITTVSNLKTIKKVQNSFESVELASR